MPGIALIGPNGAGKTTLGKHLGTLLGIKPLDIETYYFSENPTHYTRPRSKDEVIALLLADLKKATDFIIHSPKQNIAWLQLKQKSYKER